MAISIAIGSWVGGCSRLPSSDPYASLPPCVDSYCDCRDFISQAAAQEVLNAFQEDLHGLDRDQNGKACESLPPIAPALERATYFSNSEHLALGNPNNAGQENPNNWLIEREQYVLSYSQARDVLNWASWRVDSRWLGQTDRQDDFRPDSSLPAGFYQVTPGEYRRSGYDRGHMVPSGDRTATPKTIRSPF